ncbi:MBL fold metallo-hydrolase [Streptomyces rubiginosohelvolus]|uniref:MBL fold metallo-hydrolase n=1 Tax=Streptomyces rubiginosohelvolus TaxID=67362 RepID=UPI0033BD0199
MTAGAGAPGRLTEIADGVHAFVQPDGGWCLNNAGLVGDGEDAVLVDTAATRARAERLRGEVLRVVPRSPRLLVSTHFHGDHTFGNCVFPEAVVVAHERAREDVTAAGLHLTGLWPDVCWGGVEVVAPQLTYRDRLTVHAGAVRAELLHPGPAHTTGDTVVWLPEQRVLFAGDLVMNGVTPFCPMGSLAGSVEALRMLRGLRPRTVVPGHGPVGGPELLDDNEGYLLRLQRIAADGLAAGLDPLQTAREAGPGPYGDLLDAERLVPNLHRAYQEALGGERGAPLDIPALFGEMTRYLGRSPVCRA